MQYKNDRNNTTWQLSPLGYCVVGIAAIILLVLFGRLILLLAVIGGIGWLAWKFRRTIRYCFDRFVGMIEAQAQAYRNQCRKSPSAQQCYSAQFSNPFQTSRQYQPEQESNTGWNTFTTAPAGRRNAIFDVISDKENK